MARLWSYLLLSLYGVLTGALSVGTVYLALRGLHFQAWVCAAGTAIHVLLAYLMWLDLAYDNRTDVRHNPPPSDGQSPR